METMVSMNGEKEATKFTALKIPQITRTVDDSVSVTKQPEPEVNGNIKSHDSEVNGDANSGSESAELDDGGPSICMIQNVCSLSVDSDLIPQSDNDSNMAPAAVEGTIEINQSRLKDSVNEAGTELQLTIDSSSEPSPKELKNDSESDEVNSQLTSVTATDGQDTQVVITGPNSCPNDDNDETDGIQHCDENCECFVCCRQFVPSGSYASDFRYESQLDENEPSWLNPDQNRAPINVNTISNNSDNLIYQQQSSWYKMQDRDLTVQHDSNSSDNNLSSTNQQSVHGVIFTKPAEPEYNNGGPLSEDHHEESVFKLLKCHVCNKGFPTKYKLHRHLVTHTGARPFQCEYCGNSYSQATTVRQHQRNHCLALKKGHKLCRDSDELSSSDLSDSNSTSQPPPLKINDNENEADINENSEDLKNIMDQSKDSDQQGEASEQEKESNQNDAEKIPCPRCKKNFKGDDIFYHACNPFSMVLKHMTCKYCRKVLDCKSACEEHEKQHMECRPYMCKFCHRGYSDITSRGLHEAECLVNNKKGEYKCEYCASSFSKQSSLVTHMNLYCEMRPGASITTEPELDLEPGTVIVDPNLSPDADGANGMKLRLNKVEGQWHVNPTEQGQCQGQYQGRPIIIRDDWKQPNSLEKPNAWPIDPVIAKGADGEWAVKPDELIKQLNLKSNPEETKLPSITPTRIHNRKRTYICHYCSEEFYPREKLRIHIRTVHGKSRSRSDKKIPPPQAPPVVKKEEPTSTNFDKSPKSQKVVNRRFPCDECGMVFMTTAHLKMHTRVHSGERPFQCLVCGNAFTQSGSMYQHMRLRHVEDNGTYLCQACNEVFVDFKPFLSHMKLFHSVSRSTVRPYHCKTCNMAFTTREEKELHWSLKLCPGDPDSSSENVYDPLSAADTDEITIEPQEPLDDDVIDQTSFDLSGDDDAISLQAAEAQISSSVTKISAPLSIPTSLPVIYTKMKNTDGKLPIPPLVRQSNTVLNVPTFKKTPKIIRKNQPQVFSLLPAPANMKPAPSIPGAGAVSVTCGICKDVFFDQTTLNQHFIEKCGLGVKKDMCPICLKSFFDRSTMNRHIRKICIKDLPVEYIGTPPKDVQKDEDVKPVLDYLMNNVMVKDALRDKIAPRSRKQSFEKLVNDVNDVNEGDNGEPPVKKTKEDGVEGSSDVKEISPMKLPLMPPVQASTPVKKDKSPEDASENRAANEITPAKTTLSMFDEMVNSVLESELLNSPQSTPAKTSSAKSPKKSPKPSPLGAVRPKGRPPKDLFDRRADDPLNKECPYCNKTFFDCSTRNRHIRKVCRREEFESIDLSLPTMVRPTGPSFTDIMSMTSAMNNSTAKRDDVVDTTEGIDPAIAKLQKPHKYSVPIVDSKKRGKGGKRSRQRKKKGSPDGDESLFSKWPSKKNNNADGSQSSDEEEMSVHAPLELDTSNIVDNESEPTPELAEYNQVAPMSSETFTCGLCSQSYNSATALMCHMITHNDKNE